MNGREPYSDELLSAYLDGEVTPEERRHVEQGLKSSPEYQRQLQTLRALSDQLRNLQRYRLRGEISDKIAAALGGGDNEPLPVVESDSHWGELLSAYFDREANPEERVRVEQQLAGQAAGQRLLDKFGRLATDLRGLPTYQLGDDFADRVLQQITPGSQVGPAVPATQARPRRTWRRQRSRLIWTAISIAVALLLMFSLIPRWQRDDLQLVQSEPAIPETVTPIPAAEDPMVEEVVPQQLPVDPQWHLVSKIGQNTKKKLVLVYDVSVTDEGREQAAFSNLLRRHRIGFNQTVSVAPEEQDDLLKHYFLRDVQVVPQEQAADRVHLYLVRTMGRTADAIYMDLMSRPRGIGWFSLNLTTRDAHDRILNRLCEAAKVEEGMGQAVRLAASLGMLSRTARDLGAFGAIRWVEPTLVEPALSRRPAGSNGEKGPAAGGEVRREDVPADFQCEVLFVVRELRSVSTAPAVE